jgi:high affinity Mn2+ porin
MKKLIVILILSYSICCNVSGQVISRLIGNERLGKRDSVANWTIHGQVTAVYQYHPSFKAAYSGTNSLYSNAEGALSLTSTIFLGRKLWKGAAIYFNPELSGGQGFSHTIGMAGFPNGEIYRVGNPTPTPFIARAYYQQMIAIGHSQKEFAETNANQLAGKRPESRIVISFGKFCIADFFDGNSYSHDARSQFLNWSLMAAGSWDFPADVRGYTSGLVVELIKPLWAVRFAAVRVPRTVNGILMDWNIDKANSETLEGEKSWSIKAHKGVLRATGFISFTKAPKFDDATKAIQSGDSLAIKTLIPIFMGQAESTHYGGIKYGFGINAEQQLDYGVGVFIRGNWSDGHSAAWCFTQIDNSVQFGMNMKGAVWKRPLDNFGLAFVTNGLSPDQHRYLAAGGYGFIIGDGKLNYGRESILETYYRVQLASFLSITADYQFAIHPAYNKDRGPVHIAGIRIHMEF